MKLKQVIDGLALDSLFMSSSDMGVRRFNFTFTISNPVYPHSPSELNMLLNLFVK